MLKRLPTHQEVESTLNEASTLLNEDVRALDSESSLQSPIAVQVCLFLAGVAAARALQAEGVAPQAVAGLSVGAYAAAVVCGTLDFKDGLRLVKKRAELMSTSFPTGYGMSAIVGLTEQQAAELIAQLNSPAAPIYLSNINAPLQITVSGSTDGLERIEQAALKAGARKAERLNIAVPSHCMLYRAVAQSLSQEFAKVVLTRPTIPYVSNVRARPLRSAQDIAEDLAQNIAHGVRWYDSTCLLVELGTQLFVEMNPSNVLTKLVAEAFPQIRSAALEECSISYAARLAKFEPT